MTVASSSNDALAEEIDRLRLAIVRLERKLRKHSGTDVTPSQLSVLFALQRHGPIGLGELARREQVGKSTMTGLVSRLEEKRLISRVVDPSDARRHTIQLAPVGLELLESAARRSNDYLRQRITNLDPGQLNRVLDAIDALQSLASPTG